MVRLGLIVSALNYATIVFLLGFGLSLIYASLNFMNVAHPSFFTLSSFLAASLVATVAGYVSLGVFGAAVVLLAIVVVVPAAITLLAVGLKEAVFDRLSGMEEPYQLLGTFAILFIFEDVMRLIWGSGTYRAGFPRQALGSVSIGDVSFSSVMAITILIGAVTVAILYYMFERTKLGKVIVALSENAEVVSTSGIDTDAIHYRVYAIGSVLAALGGSLWVMNFSITVGLTLQFVLLAFAVMVIAGVGSLLGAVIASLLIGFVKTFGVVYVPGIEMAIVFLIMAVVIIIKPTGIGGIRS